MSVATVITQGLGSFGSVSKIITLGYGEAVTPPIFVGGGGGGGGEYRKRDREFKEARDRLRAQIELAIDGPPQLVADLEKIAKPQVADSVYVPLVDRIDVEALIARVELMERVRAAAREREIELDDEEVLSML